jgi:hypothetical protein
MESRQPRGPSWRDPIDAVMALWEAFEAERAAAKAGAQTAMAP